MSRQEQAADVVERLIPQEAMAAEERINLVRCILLGTWLLVLTPIRIALYGVEGGSGSLVWATAIAVVGLLGALLIGWRMRRPQPPRFLGYVGILLDYGVLAAMIAAQIDTGFVPSIRQSLETYALILPIGIALNALSGLRLSRRQVLLSGLCCQGLVLETVWIDTGIHGAPFYLITTLILSTLVFVTTLGAYFGVRKTRALIGRASHMEGEARYVRGVLSRYVSEPVANAVLSDELSTTVGQRRQVTLMFSDIRGFTQLSEQLPPEDVVALLNSYFSRMVDILFRYDGTLDKYMGDGMMAVFGAPVHHPDHALRAVKTAVRMREALDAFNREISDRGGIPLRIGIGIHTGECVIGNIGTTRRMDYTAIGDAVNTASRIEGLTGKYGVDILISAATYAEVEPYVEGRQLSGISVKGKTMPLDLFIVEGLRPNVPQGLTKILD